MPVFSIRCGTCGHSRGVMERREIAQEHQDGKTQRTTFYDTWLSCAAPIDLEFTTLDGSTENPPFGQVVDPRRPGCVIWARRGSKI